LAGCTVVEGHARFESANRVRVGEELQTAPRVFINVGGRAFVPDMPGVGEVPFLTNRSMLELDCLPEHLVVVGGSYVGLEFAQMYRRFGAEVTIVEKGETQGLMKVVVEAETRMILGAAILGTGGDEAIHGILDIMNAGVPYDVLERAVSIHPNVSELIPTMLGEMRPIE
jgi:pyruvate/2-oxoglutarate dehydrogenase complex dihydrolipoamide dehydrogenase (E3) component